MIEFEKFFGLNINRNIEKSIEFSVKVFTLAKNNGHIRIVGGELDKRFYSDSRIIKALEDAYNRKVKIDIIFGPEMDSGNDGIKSLWIEEKIRLWWLEKRYDKHFMVIDDHFVRIEEYHLPLQIDRKAYVYKSIWLGKELIDEFTKLLSTAILLSPKVGKDLKKFTKIQRKFDLIAV